MLALFTATAALYTGAALFFLGFLLGMPERVLPWARRSLGAGFVVHFLELGSRGIAGLHPVSSVSEAVGFLAWVAVGVYLWIERKRTLDAVGAIVAPGA